MVNDYTNLILKTKEKETTTVNKLMKNIKQAKIIFKISLLEINQQNRSLITKKKEIDFLHKSKVQLNRNLMDFSDPSIIEKKIEITELHNYFK